MATLSRWMPPQPQPATGSVAYAPLGVLSAGLLAAAIFSLTGRVIVIGLTLLIVLDHVSDQRRLRWLALARAGENLCTFARAFDRRQTNYWVLRAVYDALRPYCTFQGGRMPLRPSDSLERNLHIDSDDLTDIARDATGRVGRAFEDLEANPFYGRVDTVRDLVAFVQHQPPQDGLTARSRASSGCRC